MSEVEINRSNNNSWHLLSAYHVPERPDTILNDVHVFAHSIFKRYLGIIIILIFYLWKMTQRNWVTGPTSSSEWQSQTKPRKWGSSAWEGGRGRRRKWELQEGKMERERSKGRSEDCWVPITHDKSFRGAMTEWSLFRLVLDGAPQALASVPPGSTTLVYEWPFKYMNTLDLIPRNTYWPRTHPPPLYSFIYSTNIYECPLCVRHCLRCWDFLSDTSQFLGSTYSRKKIINKQMNLRQG